ncbi:STAS domain-containing protein [Sorangium sp. So ce406]|uniref:STAS domain-containing protein n=1 Tax=Sorangium sp. So ce406 TaxID=3133311 RepID=UPI003F5C0A27
MSDEQGSSAIERENAALRRRVAELEAAEAKLEALCSVSRAFIALINRDGVVQETFATLLSRSGRVESGCQAISMAAVVREDYIERCIGTIRESLATRTIASLEYPVRFGQDDVWCQAYCKPFTDDTVLWVAHDITAQRRLAYAQAELRDFQALVNSAPDVLHQFHTAILDVTGVKDVDAESADALLRIARAARLLGAQLVLTGIGPDTAQTLVDLGVDLTGITTRSTLQSGIAHALAPRSGRRAASVPGAPASATRPRSPA